MKRSELNFCIPNYEVCTRNDEIYIRNIEICMRNIEIYMGNIEICILEVSYRCEMQLVDI